MSDAQELIARILSDERWHGTSHFSETIHGEEPILMTGRQMSTYLPDRYRRMRAISRVRQVDSRPRWLSDGELFCLQGDFMADVVDECPYHGAFKSYFPTYSAMSDRQLRGYFTWRSAVRAGRVEDASLSFAYVYLYELINGIGVDDPLEAFSRFDSFWRAWRALNSNIDRYARIWRRDMVVYHDLDPGLIAGCREVIFDGALAELDRIEPRPLPLPPDVERERRLLGAIETLSTYRITASRLFRDHPEDMRRCACAVYARLAQHCDRRCKLSLSENLFGRASEEPYEMFRSAVFFERNPHRRACFELDGVCSYRCERGRWTCSRKHASRSRSAKLGRIMRALDCRLRLKLDPAHPLKEGSTPKYLAKIIDREIETWLGWKRDHAPRVIDIDLSKLARIRKAAEGVCEALLVDEERAPGPSEGLDPDETTATKDAPSDPLLSRVPAAPQDGGARISRAPAQAAGSGPLSAEEADWLRALLDRDERARSVAQAAARISQDMLIDAINEKMLEILGDTVIECVDGSPRAIDDYESDLKEIVRI
ncbi:hypothetical protein Corgl_0600 [Coriobacterium glomerans PW2]|uniref:TerB N-terminal domain-containing protein n=1 Tax=Coriobacterium glomerans (strain ATCC 49209 / DSM 20642 / JCM 10262 / PW2) TaxID=700015 RepID=F2NBH8_CORGP|nr:TerB N-terminal domain-containing protein [Coriobacterium glomerans]AEB06714.1 hypothetical protein Corgl_0600 [Coriobacterium glomerans PW2]